MEVTQHNGEEVPPSQLPETVPLTGAAYLTFSCAQPPISLVEAVQDEEDELVRKKVRLLFDILGDEQLIKYMKEKTAHE